MRKLTIVVLMLAVVGLLTVTTLPEASPTFASSEEKEIKLIMGDPAKGEFTFSPDRIELKNGEKVKLVIENQGNIDHEFMTEFFMHAHAIEHSIEVMIEGVGEVEATQLTELMLKPGKAVELAFRVNVEDHVLEEKDGKAEFEFGCFIPGHYKAGMKGTIVVEGEHK